MKKHIYLLLFIFLFISCKTYTVSPEKFKEQLIKGGQNKKEVETNNPVSKLFKIKYSANDLKYLNVYDSNGNIFFIPNSPSVEMRVTLKNGKRKIFYLDTVFIENDTLKGEKSKILGFKNQVPYNEIEKIEVQEGGKNYHYK